MSSGERVVAKYYSSVEAEHLHRYAIACDLVNDKIVLDIACGEGYGTNLLSKSAKNVVGVDIDKITVCNANEKYASKNTKISYLEGSLISIPFEDNYFDVIVCFESIEHISDHDRALSEFIRVLKDDGLLIISTPDKYLYSDLPKYSNPFHIKELYKEDFSKLLFSNFKYVNLFQQKFYQGSLIKSYKKNDEFNKIYHGNFESINDENEDGVYMIAIASNYTLPEVKASFFDLTDKISESYKKSISEVYNSSSFKIGKKIVDLTYTFLFWKKRL